MLHRLPSSTYINSLKKQIPQTFEQNHIFSDWTHILGHDKVLLKMNKALQMLRGN